MIRQLAHLCIHSPDLQATEAFYRDVLGCGIQFEFRKKEKRFGFYIDLGNRTFLEVFEGPTAGEGDIRHLALEVDDLDGTIRHAASKGIAVGEKKLGNDQSWQAWLEDPNGVKIELHEYTDESLQLLGGTCEVTW
jgi:catechol 2,3-dioxygenase-like lactoylglutathione lyase family enzyme